MKKIYLILFILLIKTILFAQPPAVYNTCSSMSAYNGEWLYQNGNITFKVFLKSHIFFVQTANYYTEDIIGWQEYTNSGNVIQSDYSHRFDLLPNNLEELQIATYSIALNFKLCKPVINFLYGSMKDISVNQYHGWHIKLLSTNTIEVTQLPAENLDFTPVVFSLPQTFVMVKQ